MIILYALCISLEFLFSKRKGVAMHFYLAIIGPKVMVPSCFIHFYCQLLSAKHIAHMREQHHNSKIGVFVLLPSKDNATFSQ